MYETAGPQSRFRINALYSVLCMQKLISVDNLGRTVSPCENFHVKPVIDVYYARPSCII